MELLNQPAPLTPAAPVQPAAQPVVQPKSPTGFDALGQGDFLRLLVTQLEQQDPLEPVDNKDMLAQMAQFSSLAGTTETNDTLKQILTKLDSLIAVQVSAGGVNNSARVSPVIDPVSPSIPASTQE